MKKILSISFILAALTCAQEITIPSFSFPDSTYRVGQIIYIGNELTKFYIIEHEMSLRQDSLITYAAVEYDINRVYGLRLFTKVDINVIPDSLDYATLVVSVHERWYFYPFPVAGFKDRDFDKFYYGLGVAHNNVGGRNVQLYGSFALGYDPYISLTYINPLVDIENRIFFSSRVYYTEQRNRSLVSLANAPDFDEIRSGGSIGVGKRFSLFTTVSTSVEYLNIRVTDVKAGRTLSPSGRDEFFSLHAGYVYDTRDLREYPSDGTLLSFGVSKHGLFENDVDYQRYNIDMRRFIPLGSGITIAGRTFTSLSSGGSVPNYGHVFFGYVERIRGYYNTILEGEQIAGATLELHYQLISPRYIRLGFIPFDQFKDLRYAVYLAAFGDAGAAWYRNDPVALNMFRSGYGAGLHFHLAYSAIATMEVGMPYGGPLSKMELILGLGASL